jgi:hypothetical protein
MLPDAEQRKRKLPKLFTALTRYHHLAQGGVEVASDGADGIGGAALWDPPGRWRQTRAEELRAMPWLLLAFGRSLKRGIILEEMMKEAHPEEPHWYLGKAVCSDSALDLGIITVFLRFRTWTREYVKIPL